MSRAPIVQAIRRNGFNSAVFCWYALRMINSRHIPTKLNNPTSASHLYSFTHARELIFNVPLAWVATRVTKDLIEWLPLQTYGLTERSRTALTKSVNTGRPKINRAAQLDAEIANIRLRLPFQSLQSRTNMMIKMAGNSFSCIEMENRRYAT